MVTRKASGPTASGDATQTSKPPYPVSPTDWTGVYQSKDARAGMSSQEGQGVEQGVDKPSMRRRDSDISSHGTWDTDEEEEKQEEPVEIPKPLRITPSKQDLAGQPKQNVPDDLPAILKPGPQHLAPPSNSMDQYTSQALVNPWVDDAPNMSAQLSGRSQSSNNPYFRPKESSTSVSSHTQHQHDAVSSLPPQIPQSAPPPPPPVELPTISTPSEELAQLSLSPNNRSQIQRKPVIPMSSKGDSTLSPIASPNLDSTPSSWQQPQAPTAQQKWGEDAIFVPSPGPPPVVGSLMDHVEPSASTTHTTGSTTRPALQSISTRSTDILRSGERAPDTPRTVERQRSEHYQIKHINWQDASTGTSSIRQSPILTQNANGPCPLLALVNALVLTTPENANTALVETLRTREQVSLGLLLDAVFDELTSGRRGDSAAALPDVSELYRFLLALHTGMNVNPRFVPAHSTGSTQAGTFEQTREMRLYSTFNVPLIHGWVPQQDSVAFEAFSRCAQSFEDAQNVQFAEMELEDKLRAQGLSGPEQQTLQDIQTIKHFLTTWPTQLTDFGLQTISSTLRPGQVAILFRNDHFSTIYKEPRHGALMTLVTDTGYSSHDEIVWESLVDVNGAASDLFSGDFRIVSHNQDVRLDQDAAGQTDGWQTVQGRSRTQRQQSARLNSDQEAPPLPGPRPNAVAESVAEATHTEQEDRDFALALQLQEEEDAHQRQEQERRRREQQLSEQFLSGQNEGRPPAIPPRRGSNRVTTSIRPPVNRPSDQAFDPDAPPTYEQSASDRPYREGATNNQSGALDAYDSLRRQQEQQQQQSAYAAQSTNSPTSGTFPGAHGRRTSYGRMGRRQSQLPSMPGGYDARRPGQAANAQDAEERCILM